MVAVEVVVALASFVAVALSYVVPSLAGHAHAFASSALALALASELAVESASVVGNKDSLATKVFVQVVRVVRQPVMALVLAPDFLLLASAFPSPVLAAL